MQAVVFSFSSFSKYKLLFPIQIIGRFDFGKYIIFNIHLDTRMSRKAKTIYNLEGVE